MSLAHPPGALSLNGRQSTNARSVAPADPLAASATKLLEIITKVLGPTTVIAALMFYLGWVRTDRVLRHFGVDSSLMSYSVQDYIMRSVDTTIEPLRWLLTTALAAILLHTLMTRLVVRFAWLGRWPMWVAIWAGIAVSGISEITRQLADTGSALFRVAVWAGIAESGLSEINSRLADTGSLVYSLGWTVGIGLAAYGWTVAPSPRRRVDRATDALLAWVAGALFVVGLFWTVEAYAIMRGDEVGAWLTETRAVAKPCVIVHSREALGIYTPGILTAEIVDTQSAYRYRYTGLRLLIRSGEKLFLLPASWDGAGPVTLVLSDSDGIRVDLQPAWAEGVCSGPAQAV